MAGGTSLSVFMGGDRNTMQYWESKEYSEEFKKCKFKINLFEDKKNKFSNLYNFVCVLFFLWYIIIDLKEIIWTKGQL